MWSMAFVESMVVFLVSLVIGGLGIHVGALAVTGRSDYTSAVFTALIGAVIWSLAGLVLGGLPLLGPALTFLAWMAIINWRYAGGWINAAGIAFVAWLSVLVILYLLSLTGIGGLEAVGVPGV